ncbi:flagellar hook-length control protein FliK [Metabacillus bambusae]|uniref:Flagellar hook-length control protein FliK n=1 Tax=Metabacillus bambusae TaxID=2795218 RepID=A0ABS3MX29_9BACI|nr:flagellar hook-length control protein FliK [Metabacillus bambusae]MBO1510409.1 flagellar hook-length control protein FliK [Metabacillus bambusae]
MKIAPLLQMMNQNASSFRTISNSGGSKFSEFLVGDQGTKQLPNIDHNKASSEDVSLQQITDELKAILGGGALDHVSIDTSFHDDDQTVDTKSSTVSLLENQIMSNFNDAESVKELIDQVITSPTAVGVLSLVKAIEELPNNEKVDFSPFLSKLNDVLDDKYPSYNNANSFSLLSMMQAIDQMNGNDKSLVEGEILFSKWTSDDDSTRLLIIDKLIEINNKLTDTNIMPIQETQMKKEIINDILSVPSDDEIKYKLETTFEKMDLTSIKSIVNKTVENLFAGETRFNQLYQLANDEKGVIGDIRFFSDEMIFNDDQLLESYQLISSTEDQDPVRSNLLSTQRSFNKNELYSKIDSSIHAMLTDDNQNGQKGSLIENVPLLYESLVTKLSKQDGKLFGDFSDESLSNKQELNSKINVQSDRIITAINTIVPTRQQMIDLNHSKLQPQEALKMIEVREETVTIQLDSLISKQLNLSGENQKPDVPMRQEFTNQLVNAFKTSKFAQLPNGANRLVIKLNPEHLGALTVRLVQKNGEMVARIITSTESAKDLLDHSIHQLKQALPSIQIEIERFEVNTEQIVKTFKDQNNDQEEKREKEFDDSRLEEEPENEQSFLESLKEALNTTV